MVTRNIKADTATQVNANLIGVQVRPAVVPPTYEVSELTANVQVKKYESETRYNGKPMLYAFTGSGDEIWGYTGSDEEYNGTVYNVWTCLTGVIQYPVYTEADVEITDETDFYVPIGPPENPMEPGGRSEYKLETYSISDSYYEFNLNIGTLFNPDPSDTSTYAYVDGFVINEDNKYVGRVALDYLYNEEYACVYGGEDGDGEYTMWGLIDFEQGIYLYSTVRNPAVGYNLRSNTYTGQEAYLSPVLTVTEEEVDPGYTEDVDCALSYSVDGSTWTEWPDHMTDDNNVISNIPRYMYLKFSQDVVITEE